MKKTPICLLLFVLLLTGSCKKKDKVDTNTVKLVKMEYWNGNSLSSSTAFVYDGQGRITQMNTANTSGNPSTSVTVSYSGNDITLTYPTENTPSFTSAQTIFLKTDGNGKVLQQIQTNFFEVKQANPQRSYVNDTITYEYDGSGLLKKEIRNLYDSTWFNPGIVQTSVIRTGGTTNYTVSGGNIISYNKQTQHTSITKQQASTVITSGTGADIASFSYGKKYPNKTDFSNAAILQLSFYPYYVLFNRASAHMPDKVSGTLTEKDQNGNVTFSDTYTLDPVLTYNSYGFVSSITADPATSPGNKTIFVYNK